VGAWYGEGVRQYADRYENTIAGNVWNHCLAYLYSPKKKKRTFIIVPNENENAAVGGEEKKEHDEQRQ
jgi:hypothetical protein